ncbi:TPM domain-containing protein [Actinacidiphila sp. ITFR-21]|uniref:TPM domain-containing protein n=1 Tax=Actinacidiphila sp. ITFR-21 TaxID=3075199 RepID=UPI00288B0A36|nr:TPM domain-containing protein [Streptomyces sp. ITFR-21]WNI17518.1 TPM domain-containing protein [Streptomyces sp. ITFR-21]
MLTALGAVVLVLPARPALADGPARLGRTGQVTDTVAAPGGRGRALRSAPGRLHGAHGVRLSVVYAGGFSGRSPQDRANAAAVRSGLGRGDLLLAVATRDRRYAVSADQDSGLTQGRLTEVGAVAIEPALRSGGWAGAAIAAADGYGAAPAGRRVAPPVRAPGPAGPRRADTATDNGAADLWIPVVAVAAALALGGYAVRKRHGRQPTVRADPGAAGWSGARPKPKQPTPLTALPELDRQARELLVATDDAVRTSREDVGFAAAQVGDEAAKPFGEAVEYAGGELAAAFRLRQRLDDAFPGDDETRRQMLDEILSRCTQANRRLDAESEAFDRLRALEANAPRVLARAEVTLAALPGRIAAAEAVLGPLTARYTAAALEPVAGYPAEARDRLEFARGSLDRARAALGTDHSRAAVFVRAAEGALGQAAVLADAVARRERELRAADARLRDALPAADADLARVRELSSGSTPAGDPAAGPGSGDAGLQGRIRRAESVLAGVREELAAGRYDPVAALRRVVAARFALDPAPDDDGARADGGVQDGGGAPDGGRVQDGGGAPDSGRVQDGGGAPDSGGVQDGGGRLVRESLEQSLPAARGQVAAARDVVTTHRGAIGSQARTRLAEAERRLRLAESAAAEDAGDALEHAGEADRLARDAQELAGQDLGGYGDSGGFGTGPAGDGGGGMGGAVLGGILLGGVLDGADGGRDYGGPGPGSFGGGRTRGRMGGGGGF